MNLPLVVIISTLILFSFSTVRPASPCGPYHYMTGVDITTCQMSCDFDGANDLQGQCKSGQHWVNANPCFFCCAECRPCDKCGVGNFLYQDFEEQACSRESNVVCSERRNMDVVDDISVHGTTTSQATPSLGPDSMAALTSHEQTPLALHSWVNSSAEVKHNTALLTSSVFAFLIFSSSIRLY